MSHPLEPTAAAGSDASGINTVIFSACWTSLVARIKACSFNVAISEALWTRQAISSEKGLSSLDADHGILVALDFSC